MKALGDERAFPAATARVWNALPAQISDTASVTAFRRALKPAERTV